MSVNLRYLFKKKVTAIMADGGYDLTSDFISAREINPGTYGCFGYTFSGSENLFVLPFAGVRFIAIENIFEALRSKLYPVDTRVSKYFPTLFERLKDIHLNKPDGIETAPTVLTYYQPVSEPTLDFDVRRICEQHFYYGNYYILENCALEKAVETMIAGRGGGIRPLAYRIPIMLWALGRIDEAYSYMEQTLQERLPIAQYEAFYTLLKSEIRSGRKLRLEC
jgi:hypothetical protein